MNEKSLYPLFHPQSIALVGLPRGLKSGKVFLLGLLDQGFQGPIYPIHPDAAEIDGLKAYARLSDIPGSVDMAIVMSPGETVMQVLKECAQKKVKDVVLYTSGFAESGVQEGLQQEKAMSNLARTGGFRILGPNCMGVYSPASGLAPFPGMSRVSGPIGFLSQSGSLTTLFANICTQHSLHFQHIVSYGNSCDVDFPELLDWMAEDTSVSLVCSYLEGVKDSASLSASLRKIAGRKPLIMWKVGQTEAGRRAAASHTGSLAGPNHLWQSVFRQYGISVVSDIESMLDVVMAFSHIHNPKNGRVAIISGPGGPAVSAADSAQMCGLAVPSLEDRSLDKLRRILPASGTSLKNPIDVGLAASFDLKYYLDTLEVVIKDANIDAVFILGGGASPEMADEYVEGIIRIRKTNDKPLIAVSYPGFPSTQHADEKLLKSNIPVYPTPERALRAYASVVKFARYRKSRAII